jgi:hypothetical protein
MKLFSFLDQKMNECAIHVEKKRDNEERKADQRGTVRDCKMELNDMAYQRMQRRKTL